MSEQIRERAPFGAREIATLCASLAGLGVATYLTLAHFVSSVSLSCPASGKVINCEKVTTSAQSYVFHVPVSVLGLFYFVPMLALSVPPAWRSASLLVARARLLLALVGMGFVFYLLYAELFEVKAICLWCTSVHVLTFLIFTLVVTGWTGAASPADHTRGD